MDKKKIFVVILLGAILALISALTFIKPKQSKVFDNNESTTVVEEIVNSENMESKAQNFDSQLDNDIVETATQEKAKDTNIKSPVLNAEKKFEQETPIFEDLKVEEDVTKIEEAGVSFIDPGVIDENGIIVVTRDFKIKSPKKYSFKDFGVLAAPPVK